MPQDWDNFAKQTQRDDQMFRWIELNQTPRSLNKSQIIFPRIQLKSTKYYVCLKTFIKII